MRQSFVALVLDLFIKIPFRSDSLRGVDAVWRIVPGVVDQFGNPVTIHVPGWIGLEQRLSEKSWNCDLSPGAASWQFAGQRQNSVPSGATIKSATASVFVATIKVVHTI